ncbi:phytanoyl-CoA dioxygenase family protein [Motilimonas cestriensis]|uniref:phytanoyl-CoA dioxygenase family protein n=1 Tax=Motilimonas cestriensis TaxID=2742685 RepID=UPI003DA5CBA8
MLTNETENMPTKLLDQINQHGFVLIKQLIEPSLILKLQRLCQCLIDDTESQHANQQQLDNIAITQNDKGYVVSRVNNLFQFQPKFAYLLAHTGLMDSVEAIIGESVLPSYESLVIKHPLDRHGFDWHRDMGDRSQEPVITVGIYLDEAKVDQGALKVIPQSHTSQLSVSELKAQLTNKKSKSVDVAATAGDVIIHHVNTVHASDRQASSAIRRTIYFEFRAISHFINNPRFSSCWIEKRQALISQVKGLSAEKMQNNVQLPSDFYAEQIRIEPAEYGISQVDTSRNHICSDCY